METFDSYPGDFTGEYGVSLKSEAHSTTLCSATRRLPPRRGAATLRRPGRRLSLPTRTRANASSPTPTPASVAFAFAAAVGVAAFSFLAFRCAAATAAACNARAELLRALPIHCLECRCSLYARIKIHKERREAVRVMRERGREIVYRKRDKRSRGEHAPLSFAQRRAQPRTAATPTSICSALPPDAPVIYAPRHLHHVVHHHHIHQHSPRSHPSRHHRARHRSPHCCCSSCHR